MNLDITLQNIGAIAGLWGLLWLTWDKSSDFARRLISLGVFALLLEYAFGLLGV
jgi:hypothetical protein